MKIHIGQLCALIRQSPIEPGDTLSHQYMDDLAKAGLAKRISDGWVPTEAGKLVYSNLMCKSVDIKFTIDTIF